MGYTVEIMLAWTLLGLCLAPCVLAGYPEDSGFVLPRIYATVVPRGLPARPQGFPAVAHRTITLPPPNFAAGTFHGVPPVLERYPLPLYPVAPPANEPHPGRVLPASVAGTPVFQLPPIQARPFHGVTGSLPDVVRTAFPAPTVGGSIVGGRPAVRALLPRVPVAAKVGTPVVVPAASPGPVYPPHPYKFGYESVDESGNIQFRHETSDMHNTKRGSYGYTDVYGIYRRVDYVADANGFRARIRTNEPGTATSAPAGAEYDAKPVAVSPAVIKAPRGGALVKAGVHSAGTAIVGGVARYVPSFRQHPAVSAPAVAFLGGLGGGRRAVLAQTPLVLGETVTPVHGSPTGLVHGATPVAIGHSTLVGAGHEQEVVATKVLTGPGVSGISVPHATVGVVALQPHNQHQAAGLDYKAKSR